MLANNLSWLALERAVTALVLLISNIYVVRYLGPSNFGELSIFQALLAIFVVSSEFGIRRILVTRKNSKHLHFIYRQGMRLKVCVAVVMTAIMLPIVLFALANKYSWLIFIFIVFSPLEVYGYYFEGRLKNKPIAIIRAMAAILASMLRIILCYADGPLLAIAATYLIPLAMLPIAARSVAKAEGFEVSDVFQFRLPIRDRKALFSMLRRSVYFGLSILLIQAGLRVDIFLLSWLAGPVETGIYAAPQKLFEQGVSLFSVVATVALPFIAKKGRSSWKRYLETTYAAVFAASILISLPLALLAGSIVELLYGGSYARSGIVFTLLSCAIPFVLLSNVSGIYYSLYRLEKLAFFRNLIAFLCATFLHSLMIPSLGAKGAALAFLITQLFLSLFFELLHPMCRLNAKMKWRAMISAFTVIFYRNLYHEHCNQ